MKMIFIRHGQAEDADLAKSDAQRELTPKGRQNLVEAAPSLARYLVYDNVTLVSSDLIRAVQTADIFTEAGLPKAQLDPILAQSEFEPIETFIKNHWDETLIFVGHMPYLSDWIYELTSQEIQLAKGQAVEMIASVEEDGKLSAFVNWSLPLKKYDRLLKVNHVKNLRQNFTQDIENVIEKYHGIILEHREVFLKEPEEIESVHKFRVKVRQFRSLVSFFKPLMKKSEYRQIQDVLRAMAQECAYLRELDVLMIEWKSHEEAFAKAKVSGENFLAIMKKERELEQNRLFGYLEKPTVAQELNQVVERLKKAIDVSRTDYITLNQMVEETLANWEQEFKIAYGQIHENEFEIIHPLRIRAKKMRYLMEIFILENQPERKSEHKEIKGWQETLGNMTDANRNSEAVMEIAQKYPEEDIEEELAVFNEIQAKWAEELYHTYFVKPKEKEVSKEWETEEPAMEEEKIKEATLEPATEAKEAMEDQIEVREPQS